jgi:hypothetical protein
MDQDVVEVAIDFRDLDLRRDEIELSLGYSEGAIPAEFAGMIDDVISQASQHCQIRAGYRLVDVKRSIDRSDGLYLGDTFFALQKIVTGQLKKAEKAALFVCTIGSGMEAWARQLLRDGDAALGYVVDAIASVTVENATDVLHDRIGQHMQARGMKITNRYSPGYCDWSVSEQHLLFSLLPQNFCGVTLTESAFMVPIKSVSGVVGVGASVKRVDYVCDTCGMKDCTYRSIRQTRAGRTTKRRKVQARRQG